MAIKLGLKVKVASRDRRSISPEYAWEGTLIDAGGNGLAIRVLGNDRADVISRTTGFLTAMEMAADTYNVVIGNGYED